MAATPVHSYCTLSTPFLTHYYYFCPPYCTRSTHSFAHCCYSFYLPSLHQQVALPLHTAAILAHYPVFDQHIQILLQRVATPLQFPALDQQVNIPFPHYCHSCPTSCTRSTHLPLHTAAILAHYPVFGQHIEIPLHRAATPLQLPTLDQQVNIRLYTDATPAQLHAKVRFTSRNDTVSNMYVMITLT